MNNNFKIGILGCGHLGQAIALSMINHGLPRENLLISYKGNSHTYQSLKSKGLTSCLTENLRLFHESAVVLLTVKPQDILNLRETIIPCQALIVSCMAGLPIKLITNLLGINVYRMMFSGPDTILSGKGVAAIYPGHELLEQLLYLMGLKYIETGSEKDLDIFTSGVCMPAALLKSDNTDECQKAVDRIGAEYPLLSALYSWSLKALPIFHNSSDKEAYINRMVTEGGITDAIIKCLDSGSPLDDALRRGIARTREISEEIQRSLTNSRNPCPPPT